MSEKLAERGGTIRSELQPNVMSLPGVFMQGIANISPAFSQLATFTSIIALATIVAPVAFLLAGVALVVQAYVTGQIAREFPSAGGWYTWIARTLHPGAGFFAGWVLLLWWPACGTMVLGYLGAVVLEPGIQAYYGVDIPWWIYPVAGVALSAFLSYRGMRISQTTLLITGGIEVVIMVALAASGIVSPGKGGFTLAPLNVANFGKAPDVFLAITFAVFAFSGWETIGPVAEETRHPRRYIPLALVGSILFMMVFELFVTYGNVLGVGVSNLASAATATTWPIATMAQRLWGEGWLLLLFALLNSGVANSLSAFNAGTRLFFSMGRSGVFPAALGEVSPRRRTPNNAIHTQVAVSVLALVLMAIFGAVNVFLTWAITFTFGLIIMYILADLGAMRYYLSEARDRFNVLKHVVAPIAAIVAVGYVFYKSAVPLPAPPEQWSPIVLVVFFAVGGCLMVYLHLSGRGDWMRKAELAMEEEPEKVAALGA